MANKVNKDNKTDKKFFKDVKSELKKVTWPTGKELVTNTSAVIVVVLIVAIVVFLLDVCFEKINGLSVTGIQKIVSSIEEENTEDAESVEEESVEETSESESEDVQLVVENSVEENTVTE